MAHGAGVTFATITHDRSPHLDPNDPSRATYSDVGGPDFDLAMRICEECHSLESLHNIQADTDLTPGEIVVGGELAGYGHVGRDGGPGDSDCWGCHGFDFNASSTSLTGALVPTLYNTDVAFLSAGKAATILLSGAAFTNTANGTSYESDVRLTAADGSFVTLEPDVILDQGSLAVTIPAATLPGNYKIQAAKGDVASNPTVISIVPKVTITRATSNLRITTITGSGFGGYAVGSGTTVTGILTKTLGGPKPVEATIVSWSDTKIVVSFRGIPQTVTVNSVFGSATASATGKTLSR